MDLLLASYLHPDIGSYLYGRVLYIDDAAMRLRQTSFAQDELSAIDRVAETLVTLTVSESEPGEFSRELELADCVYVASGETFCLLDALRSTGTDKPLVDAVRNGMPYVGSSAGAIIAGPSIEPASVMDDPSTASQLKSYAALNFTDFVVVPHAQGTTGPYPIEVISETVEKFGKEWNLVLLKDGQALHVDSQGARLV